MEKGYNQIIAVDEKDVVLKGWGRVLALLELGYVKAQVTILCGFTEDQKLAIVIADNKVVSTEYDERILAKELPRLTKMGLDVVFSEKEIKDLLLKVKDKGIITESTYDMSPRLYEHYNYIMMFFDNEMDFKYAKQLLRLPTVQDRMKPEKVGILRAIPGMKAIEIIKNENNNS